MTAFHTVKESSGNIASFLPYGLAIFLSAFLLFQVEPIIARYILPWFGGGPAIWTTCMLFFQLLLLVGYSYAHLLAINFSPKHQILVHLSLVVVSLLFLPITPSDSWKPVGDDNPMLVILLLLSVTIGGPFLLISASGPLLQHWFSRAHPTLSPYRLYALSNVGSLLGLLSYPFWVEPHLSLGTQTLLWSAGYVLYALMTTWGAIQLFRLPTKIISSANSTSPPAERPPFFNKLLMILLSACGSLVLLASTNQICRDVAVIPFLWVFPLSLYLLSFILCFDHPRWYHRGFWTPFLFVSLSFVVFLLGHDYGEEELNLSLQIVLYSAALFGCCMVCHGELVRLKPPTTYLTSFYLMIALGGALGGLFVNLVAPVLFNGYWEFHAGLIATVVLLGICVFHSPDHCPSVTIRVLATVLWMGWIGLLITFLWAHIQEQQVSSILTQRNFYGVLRVYEEDMDTPYASRSLYHGRISHGAQFLNPPLRSRPRTYYGPDSGISWAIRHHPHQLHGQNLAEHDSPRPFNVGIIGLGVGTIAAFSRPGDSYRFYEIDPDVVEIATTHFTYLGEGQGKQQVILGDGRISLEREFRNHERQQFDVLAIDAFSSDAIPIHLLTKEAFALYWEHLNNEGILAVNISNRHLDLSPVVRVLARELGKEAVWIEDLGEDWDEENNDSEREFPGTYGNDWVLVTSNHSFLHAPEVVDRIEPWPTNTPREILWTDDYSNLFEVISH